jgi:hypothetical protein
VVRVWSGAAAAEGAEEDSTVSDGTEEDSRVGGVSEEMEGDWRMEDLFPGFWCSTMPELFIMKVKAGESGLNREFAVRGEV